MTNKQLKNLFKKLCCNGEIKKMFKIIIKKFKKNQKNQKELNLIMTSLIMKANQKNGKFKENMKYSELIQ